MDSVVDYPVNDLLQATRALQFIQLQLLELARDCGNTIQSSLVSSNYFLQLQHKLEKLLYETCTAWGPPLRKPRINDFTTLKFVGSGTFGIVNLVCHRDTRQAFAMKLIKRQNLTKRAHVQQVLVERDILTYTDSPFLVSMFCAFETERELGMVMEYVGGGDCASLLHHYKRLPLDLTRLYIAETVCAVEYIHSYGILHRDLKPSKLAFNLTLDVSLGSLLISSTGHIKLTDFGLSKIGPVIMEAGVNEGFLEKIVNEFTDREISGTPLYIAPEVYLSLSYGKPVDWWALGIIMYQFLVGFTPFSGDSLDELGYQVIKSEVIWPRDEDALPPDAQNLIMLLLMKNCVRRLGTRGVREVKEHPFFQELNLDDLLSENSQFVPHQQKEDDTSCFKNQSETSDFCSNDDDNNNDTESSADCESIEDEVESSEDTEQASLELPYFCSVTFRFREVYNSSLVPSSYSQLKQSCLFKKPLYWRLDEEQGEDDDDDNDEGYGEEDTEDSEDLMDQGSLEDQEDLERDTEELCNDIMFLTIRCAEEEGEEKEIEKREENERKVERWEEKNV